MSGQQRACLECGGLFTVRKDHQKQKFCGMACAIKGKRYRKKDESIIPCTICLRRAGIGHRLIPRLIPIVSDGWIYSAWRSVGFNPSEIPTWRKEARNKRAIKRRAEIKAKRDAKPRLPPKLPKILKNRPAFMDITGQSFGQWTVISRIKQPGKATFLCECSCGNQKAVRAGRLHSGRSKSCGCSKRKSQQWLRIKAKLRQHMKDTIKRLKTKGGCKQGKTVDMIGCSIAMLREHIETQFAPGMNWDNHGTMWEIDHIMPLARFDLTNAGHVRMAARYTNLQPMWKEANAAKSDQLIEHQAILL